MYKIALTTKVLAITVLIFSCTSKKTETPVESQTEVVDSTQEIEVDSSDKSEKASIAQSEDSYIIGTWISEEDKSWTLTFSEDKKCIQHFGNDGEIETDVYSISNTTPQCGETVPVKANTSYLQLVNLGEEKDTTCYEIAGLENSTLTIRPVDKGNFFVFKKK